MPGNHEQVKPYVIVPSWNGTFIVNRLDRKESVNGVIGVGAQILDLGSFDRTEVEMVVTLLKWRREQIGRRITAYDLGANIGAHAIKWGL